MSVFNNISIETLLELSPEQFEYFVADIFRSMGFQARVTRQSGDNGIDIELRKAGKRYVVQCKRYRGTVGEPTVREFYGSFAGIAEKGFFVTTGNFTDVATRWIGSRPLELIDGKELIRLSRKNGHNFQSQSFKSTVTSSTYTNQVGNGKKILKAIKPFTIFGLSGISASTSSKPLTRGGRFLMAWEITFFLLCPVVLWILGSFDGIDNPIGAWIIFEITMIIFLPISIAASIIYPFILLFEGHWNVLAIFLVGWLLSTGFFEVAEWYRRKNLLAPQQAFLADHSVARTIIIPEDTSSIPT